MNRTAYLALAVLASLGLALGCGEDMGTDGGVDGGEADTGVETPDSGPELPDGGPPDAGPQGCQTDCEFVEVDLGTIHSCARRANGEVLCWGRAQEYQLGDGRSRHEMCNPVGGEPEDCSSTPVNVRYLDGTSRLVLEDATQLTMQGFASSCALREGGELWCWSEQTVPDVAGGIPRQRQVAERDLASLDGIHQASVSGGHMCAIHGTQRRVLCAGSNSFGQLGTGEFDMQVIEPGPVLLDPAATPATELEGVEEIAVSHGAFTCARTADAVYCWGRNASDQFGDGSGTVHQECVIDMTDRFDCSTQPVRVGDPEGTPLGAVADLSVGSSHVCVIEGEAPGQVLCWGDNRGGQVAQPDTAETVGLPTAVVGVDDAVQVATGSGFTCALHADGGISCWGLNLRGQLGDGTVDHGTTCTSGGDTVDCSRTPVMVSTIDDATSIAANGSHACAIRADGSVWCWGRNSSRQLGHDLGPDGRDNSFEPVMVKMTGPM